MRAGCSTRTRSAVCWPGGRLLGGPSVSNTRQTAQGPERACALAWMRARRRTLVELLDWTTEKQQQPATTLRTRKSGDPERSRPFRLEKSKTDVAKPAVAM